MKYRVRKVAWIDSTDYTIYIDSKDTPLSDWQLAKVVSCKDAKEWDKRGEQLEKLIEQNRFTLHNQVPCEVVRKDSETTVLRTLFEPEERYFFV